MENHTHCLREANLVLSTSKNCKLKVKLGLVGALERNRRTFFVPFILSARHVLNMCFISMYSVLNTLSEYT